MHPSAACAISAMSTANKSNYSAVGTLRKFLGTSVPNRSHYANPNPTYHTTTNAG